MPTLARNKILVVDDEPMIGKSCKEILEGEGYSVDTANSGQEGVQKALENIYDLVIVSMETADVPGVAVLKRIRGEKLTTPVVMMTAHSTLETAIEAMKLGAADYLPKPFPPGDLSAVVKAVISGETLTEGHTGRLIDKESVEKALGSESPRAAYMIDADIEKCIGCQMCMIDCAAHHADENKLPISYPKGWDLLPESRLFVDLNGAFPVPLLCKHCENAPCATVCPTGAIRVDEKNGFKILSKDKCIGCRSCLLACPFGLVSMDNEGKAAQKCDMCMERLERGIDPVCVLVCPRGALSVQPVAPSMDEVRKKTAEQMLKSHEERKRLLTLVTK